MKLTELEMARRRNPSHIRILQQKHSITMEEYTPLFILCQAKTASTNDFRHHSGFFVRAFGGNHG